MENHSRYEKLFMSLRNVKLRVMAGRKVFLDEPFLSAVKESKAGWLRMRKVSDTWWDFELAGYTYQFAEVLPACIRLKNQGLDYFHTSNVIAIDWKNHLFHTLNSTYEFDFVELTPAEVDRKLGI